MLSLLNLLNKIFDISIRNCCWKKNLTYSSIHSFICPFIHPTMGLNSWEEEVCWWMLAEISVNCLLPLNWYWEKNCWSFCQALVSPHTHPSLYFPLSCWVFENRVVMLMFSVRKKQNFFQIGPYFEATVVGVVWAVSSLPKHQLILVVPGSDLLLK